MLNGNVYVLTDSQGNFRISAWNACPGPNTFMYVLSTHGDPGTVQNNPNLAIAAIIPTACGTSWFLDVSETTTVAAAYALGSFATVSTDSFATDSNSVSALQAAVAYSSTLINTSNAVIPKGSIRRSYSDRHVPSRLDIALNSNLDLISLFNAIPSRPSFQPVLTSAPSSWTLPGSSIQIMGITPQPAPAGTTVGGSEFEELDRLKKHSQEVHLDNDSHLTGVELELVPSGA
jgi:hypothetical protein